MGSKMGLKGNTELKFSEVEKDEIFYYKGQLCVKLSDQVYWDKNKNRQVMKKNKRVTVSRKSE